MKMLFFFDRYPLVKLNFFFFVSHICLVLLQNGRKEMDKLVETTDCWPNLGEKWKSISNINRYLLYQILLRRFLFYYPFMHLWQKHDYAWWRGDRGDRGGNIQGFYLDNRNSIPKYIFELRVDTGDLSACLVIFPRICQIIILMNYKAVIGTKAASTEWFPTLSKWSLWRGAERRYW